MVSGRSDPRRVTIVDIARAANVSKGAVSYALNGRPGVSEATRRRILDIAGDLGWYPNSAARALSKDHARATGLVLSRPARTLAVEPFFMELVSGIEAELSAHSIALTLQVVEDPAAEIEVYRRWWSDRRVDGVLLVDLMLDDPRIPVLEELGLPVVVIGGPDGTGALSALWSADAQSMEEVVRYFALLGHRRIARVAGIPRFLHTRLRTDTFERLTAELDLDPLVVSTDFGRESGASATRRLLSDRNPPTAIVYDNDIMAVAGLGVAQEAGLSVPADVSIISWEDSFYCEAVHPALTAVTRDVSAHGARAARALIDLVEDGRVVRAAMPVGQVTVRRSTGPARRPPPAARPKRSAPPPAEARAKAAGAHGSATPTSPRRRAGAPTS